MPSKELYFDSMSSTAVRDEILNTYDKVLRNYYANSGSHHRLGHEVRRLEERSREEIKRLLKLSNTDVIFTSGATEANNLALKGFAFQKKKGHIITSQIEHASVLKACRQLEKHFGFEVTYLPVDTKGYVDLKALKHSLRSDTILVSIAAINNEIGSFNDPKDWVPIVKEHSKAVTHCDAVQALAKLDLDYSLCDMVTFSAHKIHGLKGSGALLKKQHIELLPLLSGGDQEYGLRAGTSNAPVNIVLAKTIRLAQETYLKYRVKNKDVMTYLKQSLKAIDEVSLNGQSDSPYILNFSVKGLTSEVLMNALNNRGIYVSAISTCNQKEKADSHVLEAIAVDKIQRTQAVRIGLDYQTEQKDIDYFIENLKEIIEKYAI